MSKSAYSIGKESLEPLRNHLEKDVANLSNHS
jgi:hypothetical protein